MPNTDSIQYCTLSPITAHMSTEFSTPSCIKCKQRTSKENYSLTIFSGVS